MTLAGIRAVRETCIQDQATQEKGRMMQISG